jgi:hypothetical protein
MKNAMRQVGVEFCVYRLASMLFTRGSQKKKASLFYCQQITSPSEMSLYSLKVQTLVASASTEKVTMWKNSEVKLVISE